MKLILEGRFFHVHDCGRKSMHENMKKNKKSIYEMVDDQRNHFWFGRLLLAKAYKFILLLLQIIGMICCQPISTLIYYGKLPMRNFPYSPCFFLENTFSGWNKNRKATDPSEAKIRTSSRPGKFLGIPWEGGWLWSYITEKIENKYLIWHKQSYDG